jgi:hypothetical protein
VVAIVPCRHLPAPKPAWKRLPWGTFWLGLAIVIAVTIPIVILLALPFGPAKFIGWILLGCITRASLPLAPRASLRISAKETYGSKQPLSTEWIHPWIGHPRTRRLLPVHRLALRVDSLMLITSFGATGFALLNWISA